jgi:NADH-quinone oxidoreductase subunit N
MNAPVFTSADAFVLLPAILLVLFACGTLLVDVVGRRTRQSRRIIVVFGMFGIAVTGLSIARQWSAMSAAGVAHFTAAQGAMTVDGLSFFSNAVTLAITALFYLISYQFLEINAEDRAEYYALALFAEAGMYVMATASELVTLFLGLELTAICFYILVGFTRRDRRSNEAALKYLLLGGVASGFLLYGFSLLYGIAGSTELSEISTAVRERGPADPVLVLAIVTIAAALLFKISAVPFHSWTPDAYDGAPTPVTAYLSVASKVASFAVLIRLMPMMFASVHTVWIPVLTAASVASMSVGTIAALTQSRLKRLFAYSSIAHAGYLLLGLVAQNENGLRGVYIYLIVYAAMEFGAFTVLTSLHRRGISGETLADLRGLSKTHPLHAALFVVLLLSLAGIPPTAGFIGKYYIFMALIETGHYALAAVASAYVAVSLYFYFRLVREMYLQDAEVREPLAAGFGIQFALYATAALTVFIGIFPEPILRLGFRVAGVGQ